MRITNPYSVLRNKFPEEEYVLISEVPDNVSTRNRYLDFMLINLWASRGLAVTGIEMKSNRGNWLSELKNPKKQENHFKYCDYFYLLTDKDEVAKLDEIPETWGWYHITERGILKTLKPAPKLQSEPINRVLLCGMLRRAQDKKDFLHKDAVQIYVDNKVDEVIDSKTKVLQDFYKKYTLLLDKVRCFEKFSGIELEHTWEKEIEGIGDAVRVLSSGGVNAYIQNFEKVSEQVKRMDKGISEKIRILQEIER